MAPLPVALCAALACALLCVMLWMRRCRRPAATSPPPSATAQLALLPPADVLAHVRAAAASRLLPQVFISHTGQDQGAKTFAAAILKPALEAAGLKVFMDYAGLDPGDEWRDRLVEGAANSAVVVAVLSRSYPHRFWCCLELDLALRSHSGDAAQQRPLVIPVYYDAADAVTAAGQVPAQHAGDNASGAAPALSVPLAEFWSDHHWRNKGPPSDFQLRWLDPAQWQKNLETLPDQLQAPRRTTYAAFKDCERRLADAVVSAALRRARPGILLDRPVFGFDSQVRLTACKVMRGVCG